MEKAPDKIYLGVGSMSGDEPNKRYIYAEWNEEPRPLVQNIAYIRKEALLEWAKEQKAKYQTVAYANGERRILNELIDKLNSL